MTDDAEKWKGMDKDLVTTFFYVFSRFEYALKRAGFLKVGPKAEPNWEVFTNTIAQQWGSIEGEPFKRASEYFIANPPQQQVANNGALGWADRTRDNGESDAAFVLKSVRRVRNNLFHGGKFPTRPVPPPERDTQLLQNAIAVLRGALTVSAKVRSYFEEDA